MIFCQVLRRGFCLFLFVGESVCPGAARVDGREMLSSRRGVVFFAVEQAREGGAAG